MEKRPKELFFPPSHFDSSMLRMFGIILVTHFQILFLYLDGDAYLDELISSLMIQTRDIRGTVWNCGRCNKQNKTKSHMVDHIESAHLQNTARPCPYCGKPQKNRNCLRVHVSTYHRDKSASTVQIHDSPL